MTSFTDVFGGQTVPPSEPSLTRIDLAADGALAWPDNFSGTAVDEHLASSIVEVSLSSPFVLSLPPADRASVGTDILIRNVGSAQLSVNDAEGGAVTVVDPGESKYFYVQVNLTAAGIWQAFTYGTGTSGADASLLAGMGLQADTSNKLQLYVEYRSINSDTDIVVEDRAKVVEIVAGAVTVTLPQASEAGNGFSVMLRNSSDGGVVVDGFGSEQVDGALNKTLFPGESCVLVCNGTYWISVGYGRDAEFMFSEVVVDASLSNITLTSSEVAGRMIRVAGVATGNVTITLPTVDNIYFVSVESGVGGFQVELKTSLPGSSVSLAANQSTILYCDGSNVGIAINTALVSTLNLADGSATVPSIRYSLDSDTGLFRSGAGQVSFSSDGVATAGFNGSGLFSTTAATADSTTKVATAAFVQNNFTERSITAGDGLTGGGTLATSRTLTLGTPTTLTTGTANAVTAASHTHEVTFPVTRVAGRVGDVTLGISDIAALQTTLDGKAASSHTHSYLPLAGGTVSGNVTFGSPASGTTVGPAGMTIGKGTAVGANTQIVVTPESGALGRDSQIMFGATFSDGWGGADVVTRYAGAIRFGASGGTADPRNWAMRILTGEDFAERMRISADAAIFQPAVFAPAFVGPLSGNAATATKLVTARTINGVAFDGSANINIIERGANSNGIYVRYADGTQICYTYFSGTSAVTAASGSSFVSSEVTWVFPAAFNFADNITLSGSVLGTGACDVRMGSSCTAFDVAWRLHSSVSGTFTNPRVIAIGSWK